MAERFELIAFVFMPEHVHLLVHPVVMDAKVGRLLASTKQPASKQIKQLLEASDAPLLDQLTVQERPGKTCCRFWQAGGGFDRNLFSHKAIQSSIGYIHRNPVERGLCRRATDWKWSSARFYEQGFVDPGLPSLAKPSPEWFESGVSPADAG